MGHQAACREVRQLRVSGPMDLQASKICTKCGLMSAESHAEVCPDDGTVLVECIDEFVSGSCLAQRYVIEDKIGAGGSAVVYQAYDQVLDRKVALKVLHGFLGDPYRIKRFQREAQTIAKLDHANICAVYDLGFLESGRPYMAMELLVGTPSSELSGGGKRMPIDKAVAIAMQACDALAAAHEVGVIHRDVKPENIFLNSEGVVKLLDFGLASLIVESTDGRLTATGQMLGTPGYMSPEQYMGRALEPPADLYSLGCVLFEMLTGEPPFDAPNVFAMMREHVDSAPPRLSQKFPGADFPDSLEQVVQKSLAKDPKRRFQRAEDLKQALARSISAPAAKRLELFSLLQGGAVSRSLVALFAATFAFVCASLYTLLYLPGSDSILSVIAPNAIRRVELHERMAELDRRATLQEAAKNHARAAVGLLDNLARRSSSGSDAQRYLSRAFAIATKFGLPIAGFAQEFEGIAERLLVAGDVVDAEKAYKAAWQSSGILARPAAVLASMAHQLAEQAREADEPALLRKVQYVRALALLDSIAGPSGKAREYLLDTAPILNELGWQLFADRHYASSLWSFKRLLAVSKESGYLPSVGTTLTALATVNDTIGNAAEAVDCARKSFEIAKGNNDMQEQIEAAGKLAFSLHHLGRSSEAAQWARRTTELMSQYKGGWDDGMLWGPAQSAIVFLQQGELQQAEQSCRAAISYIKRHGKQRDNLFRLITETYLQVLQKQSGREEEVADLKKERAEFGWRE